MNPARETRVCLVQQSASLDGSAFSGLLLADGLRAAGHRTAVVFGRDGPMLERYRAAGHAASVVPHLNWLRTRDPARFLKHLGGEIVAAQRMHATLRRLDPDVVYLNSVVSLAGAIAARRLGRPAIWHLRELFEDVGGEMRMPALFRPLLPWILRHYSFRLAVISRTVGDNLLGRHAETAALIANAGGAAYDAAPPDVEPRPRARFGLPPHGRIIGVPGTLRPMKGHPFLFAALPAVLARWPDVHVAVTGDGEPAYGETLRRQAHALQIEDRVHFLGSVEEMPAFYRACDVVCVPSRSEGFGRTVIEAFAMGIPVVTSNAGGLAEIVRPGVDGLLVAYGDTAALAKALSALLQSPGLRARLAQCGREHYLQDYRTEPYQQRVCALVAGALASARGSSGM